MEKIKSFKIDHTRLKKGLYVSDVHDLMDGRPVTTFDIRMKEPYKEEPMSTGGIHAIEHIGATFLRSYRDDIIYFGPMGCRTGFYLIMESDEGLTPRDIWLDLMVMFIHIADFEGPIPGATMAECGNYTDMRLLNAKMYAKDYLQSVLWKGPTDENTKYPE